MRGCLSPIPRARDDGLMTQDRTPDSDAAIAAGEAYVEHMSILTHNVRYLQIS